MELSELRFSRDSSARRGRRYTCKDCDSKYQGRTRNMRTLDFAEAKREVEERRKTDNDEDQEYEIIECKVEECGYISIGRDRALHHRMSHAVRQS